MKTVIAIAALVLIAACAADRWLPPELAHLPKSEVRVATHSGAHRFQVRIAADAQSRERGLMFVRKMPADHGMLFLFERPHYASFWMKDTYLSLDLVFIDADGIVVNVSREAEPYSLRAIVSAAPVVAVLEVRAGTAARIGLTSGDRVEFPEELNFLR